MFLKIKKIFRIPPSPFSQRELHLSHQASLQWSLHPLRSPVCGGQKPQGREDVTALRCSEPLRYKVGGPIKGLAILCGMGPQGDNLLIKAPLQLPVIRSQTFFTTRIKGHIDLLKEYLSELVIPLHEALGKSY